MKKATVVWFNDEKGFGFIKDDDDNRIFVHYSTIESKEKRKSLTKGQIVKFMAKEEFGTTKTTRVIPNRELGVI